MKISLTLVLLTFANVTSFAQFNDTSIVAKSETIELKYSPKTPVTKTRITFLKFKDAYGIQLFFLTPNKYISHIFIETNDSLVLEMADKTKLVLNRLSPDTKYKEIHDSHIFQLAFFVDKAQFDKLRKTNITEILTSHGARPLTLRIKKDSQKDILGVAALF